MISARAIGSPSPIPPFCRVRWSSAWPNGSNTRIFIGEPNAFGQGTGQAFIVDNGGGLKGHGIILVPGDGGTLAVDLSQLNSANGELKEVPCLGTGDEVQPGPCFALVLNGVQGTVSPKVGEPITNTFNFVGIIGPERGIISPD